MSDTSTHPCVFCGSELPNSSRLCNACGSHQVPKWVARITVNPLWRFLRLLVLGAVVGLGGMVFQEESAHHAAWAERSRDLVSASIGLQTLSEQLQHPCPLDKENEEECGNIYEERVAEFARLAYLFKISSRALLRDHPLDSPVHHAIDFMDEMYNPGALDVGRMMVQPLQIELLRSRELLSTPREEAKQQWCSVENTAQLRALAASLDTYRYCYRAVRSFVQEEAYRNWLSSLVAPVEPWPEFRSARRRLENCSGMKKGASAADAAEPDDIETRANRIFELVSGAQSPNYAAAWHHDLLCKESPRATVAGGLIPSGSEQLVVVTTDDWNAPTGTLRMLERKLGGPWQSRGNPVVVNVGRNGLAWGRGLHPFPGLTVGDQRLEDDTAPDHPKQEGDGRAPAGIFRLGRMYFDPAFPPDDPTRLRLDAQPTASNLFCEDRPEQAAYNTIVTLSSEQQAACAAVGRCPERMLREEDGAYHSLILVEHNRAQASGGGSCIFLHNQRGEGVPTAGCTSAPQDELSALASWLDHARTPVLLQLPRAEYEARQAGWVLPPL